MAQWEWIIIELLVLGVLVYELFSVRRSIRQARDAAPAPLPGQGTAEPARRWGAGLSGVVPPSAPAPRNPER